MVWRTDRQKRGVKDLVERRSTHLGPIRSPIMQWWDQLQATVGLRTSTGQCLRMAVCDFEMQDFDCSRNQTWGVCCVESQSEHITAVCMTKDPEHRDGHHASQNFNRVNGPADGPHPGWRELQWPWWLQQTATSHSGVWNHMAAVTALSTDVWFTISKNIIA